MEGSVTGLGEGFNKGNLEVTVKGFIRYIKGSIDKDTKDLGL